MWQLLCENIFIATVKEESLTQPPLLLCNLSKAREESFIWVKFLCKAPCESAHWGCAARAGGCTESQVSVSPKVWFNFFINYLGDRAGTILIQWAAVRHQGGAAVTSEDWLGVQHGLIKSERVSGKKKKKAKDVSLEASTATRWENQQWKSRWGVNSHVANTWKSIMSWAWKTASPCHFWRLRGTPPACESCCKKVKKSCASKIHGL